jgi:hypothetical protein
LAIAGFGFVLMLCFRLGHRLIAVGCHNAG